MTLSSFVIRSGKTILYFGMNSLDKVSNVLSRYRRIYIVTSRSAAKVSGALDDVMEILNRYGVKYEVFSGVTPNPLENIIEDASECAWRFGAEAIIAIGGGSVIDTAKIVSVISRCGGRVKDYVFGTRDFCGSLPLIAINLTHGTGSEVNRYAVATLLEPRTKYGLANEYMYPLIGIDDPRYTLSLPYNQTLYTSIDAMYHALEASCGRDSSPYVLAIAEEAIKNIVTWLPIALREPKNIEARYWLLYASMLAGISIDHSRAHLIHAIENVLSGINTELPHGAGLAMLGPTAIKYLYRSRPKELHRLLRHIDPELKPSEDDAIKASRAIEEFQKGLGFNERLSNYGFRDEDIDRVIETTNKYLRYGLSLAPIEIKDDIIREIVSSAL
ncbi:iron-containing alcohol dehydrogenase [Ignisphaera aggregans DSM 17230]|uniref:Iron-containing alcohol dehydrogenase n=1 Tax=Ignisphaera aggregans (strain DSM 17230 / JCM 13409 / AQ1.S1) TaxID=583356 RepID=E0SRH9_IGNAA|nr:iron-containing alcohol dehydrogenase [Ignisphaera aggregans DSM 17230]